MNETPPANWRPVRTRVTRTVPTDPRKTRFILILYVFFLIGQHCRKLRNKSASGANRVVYLQELHTAKHLYRDASETVVFRLLKCRDKKTRLGSKLYEELCATRHISKRQERLQEAFTSRWSRRCLRLGQPQHQR